MVSVIENSINTDAVFAENQIGNATFENYMKKFRLDQLTGIDLPGEVAGTLNRSILTRRKSISIQLLTVKASL